MIVLRPLDMSFHLRHLNLSFSTIRQLPESVSSLLNLHTLLLRSCDRLEKLPDKTRNLVNLRHLDIADTWLLKKLPSGIGMLTNLQTLSKFTLEEGDGATITELKKLNKLCGSLSIEGLQNVQDAKLANLKEKQGLEELVFRWVFSIHGRNHMSVLKSLEPHQNLKRLYIWSYGGAEFPSWVSNMSQLVSLDLQYCGETKLLPPLGQLRSLKELHIVGLWKVETIGVEFYGNAVVPFPSLERLKIGHMSKWREWNHHGNMGFPNLQKLTLMDCPKLIGSLPSGLNGLRHLSELQIIRCGNLVSFPPLGLPCSLKRIYVEFCDALECFPTICAGNTEQCHFPSLRELSIRNCANLASRNLTTLETEQCENLRQPIAEWGLGMLSSLWKLGVSGICPATASVVSFPDDDCCWLPTSLKELDMADFLNLESVSMGLQKLTSLRNLEIRNCPKLQSLPREALPHSLVQLSIYGCPLLKEHYPTGKMELLSIHPPSGLRI